MKNSKNIDRLFQEKFKDFEATPNEKIWKNIESSLQEKEEKRRIIPFWWKLSGIAALIAVGFFIGKEYSGNSNLHIPNPKNEVVTKTTISNDATTNENTAIVEYEKGKSNEEISKVNKNSTSENKNLVNENKFQKQNFI